MVVVVGEGGNGGPCHCKFLSYGIRRSLSRSPAQARHVRPRACKHTSACGTRNTLRKSRGQHTDNARVC